MSIQAAQILRILIIILIPIVIIVGVVRLVATESFLSFEYSRSDFPEDPFGFDRSQRLSHAADNFKYVIEQQPVDALAGQKHEEERLYNSRELEHMQDVQNVFRAAWRAWQAAWILAGLSILILARHKRNLAFVASAVRTGGALTVGMVVVVGFLAIIAWQVWFVVFHQLFFQPGSWTFDFSNTLIRLFPEKFWYDTVLTISSLSVIAGFLVYWSGSQLSKNGSGKRDRFESGQSQIHSAVHP